MRSFWEFLSTLFVLGLFGVAAWLLGLDDVIRASIASGRLLDWIMGGLCLLWLLVVLKVPWDLYFQAQEAGFELQRSRERGIAIAEGREAYVQRLRGRLATVAVGVHLASALLVAGITFFTGGRVGYFFAVFYLVSTAFRPLTAACVHLSRKLAAIIHEASYPREDVVELRMRADQAEEQLKAFQEQLEQLTATLDSERGEREAETRELREKLFSIGREFEVTVGKLSDNREIIQGIQAFVRLVAQSASS